MAVALDSDAVIGFLDRGDALHSAARERLGELLKDGIPMITSVITYAEVLTGAKRGRHDEALVRGFFNEVISEVRPVDVATAERAAELRTAQIPLRMPDALILASAEFDEGVDRLLSGDRRMAQRKGVRVAVDLISRTG